MTTSKVSVLPVLFQRIRLSGGGARSLCSLRKGAVAVLASPPPPLPQKGVWSRGIKSTITIHPEPLHKEDQAVLEKVLKERESSEDLPEGMANPYQKPRRVCILCKYGIEPNYKNTRLLYQFVSPYTGNVYGRHITGLCKDKHTKVEEQVRISASLGWMSNFVKEPEFLQDPKLCDPEKPVRPHKY